MHFQHMSRSNSHQWCHCPCSLEWRWGFEREVQGCSWRHVQQQDQKQGWIQGWRGSRGGWCWSRSVAKAASEAGPKPELRRWCWGWKKGSLNRERPYCRRAWSWDSPPEQRGRTKNRQQRLYEEAWVTVVSIWNKKKMGEMKQALLLF